MFGLLLIPCLLGFVHSQQIFDCPPDWVVNNLQCYKFFYDPKLSFEQARGACAIIGTSLVSINDKAEHDFVNGWLQRNDYYRNVWYTSGYKEATNANLFQWTSDSSQVLTDGQFWLSASRRGTGDVIVYSFDGSNYGWGLSAESTPHSYICEISQSEAYRLVQENRDFDYGQIVENPANLKYGPQLILQPTNLVVVSATVKAMIECQALGNPQPTYKWFRGQNRTELTSNTDRRYTLTNGKLTIQDPKEEKDANLYQCVMENEFGKIFSDPVTLSFGYLGEFSNVRDAPVYANAFDGAVIHCSNIQYKPAAVFNWQRGSPQKRDYIYSETTPYIFISNNGRLYFSEVTIVDQDDYYCQISLTSLSGSALGTSQAPSKTSLPIYVSVRNQAAKTDWGPEIQDDFIAVFPQPPLKGQDIRLECFAYGSAVSYLDMWSYTWTRTDGKPMPENVEYEDYSRVMVMRNARLEDQGWYTCTVRRGQKASDSRSLYLRLEAKPYFIIPLQNQHVDIGSQLTWRCEANAFPAPTYSWYKDGKLLQSASDGSMTITGNTMVVQNLVAKIHDGMYQCSASNIHGTSFSSAQLRVLAFPPTFAKYPLVENMVGALNGNITIKCLPEAAPKATITWVKNGANMNLRIASIQSSDRVKMLPNGYLHITALTYADAAQYTCMAENSEGTATSSGRLEIKDATVITTPPPRLTTVVVNQTAFLPCEASHDSQLELVYVWKLNGHKLDVENDPYYRQTVTRYLKGLYIQNIQLYHKGNYECWAKTPLNQAVASGYVNVNGPPGEPAGLFGDSKTVTAYAIRMNWFPGSDNGSPILYYMIQSEIEFEPGVWRTEAYNIPDRDTLVTSTTSEVTTQMRSYLISGLRPGNGYRFKIQAINQYGFGKFSLPSQLYQTNPAPPIVAPTDVRGGGGSVGDLTMVWNKLPLIERGGPGVGYHLYWRRYDPNPLQSDVRFSHAEIKDVDQTQFVKLVGRDNYYLQYEVKMQAYNNYGKGPNSSVSLVYSAEGMPVAAPQNVFADGYNSTAMLVTWDTIPDTRESMKGRVLGYQMNYWADEDVDPVYKRYIRFRGQVGEGLAIGLWADSNFWFEIQVYNTAGLGPVGEKFMQETSHSAPMLYPQEVHVWSHTSTSVRVTWRGISTAREEDVLDGFRLYLWPANEHYRTAEHIDTEKFDNENFVLTNLEKGKVYALRIAGISAGGEGKKSPTIYFTLGGQVQLDPTLSEIQAGAQQLTSFSVLMLLAFVFALTFY